MRIFDPKDQLGNSLLSQADTQKSSVKLEKQMAVGGGAITLTSADISDIENWELSSATVTLTNESKASFLPDTVRNSDGSLTINFGGDDLTGATLVMKRSAFDGMKPITIEVKIQRLMAKTMAAATAPTSRTPEEVQDNIREWKRLGQEAKTVEPTNYPYANCSSETELTEAGFNTRAGWIESDVCLISLETVNNTTSGTRTFPNVRYFGADLPSLKEGSCMFYGQRDLDAFTGKIPNIINASQMFCCCSGLTSWNVELPNSLTNASAMFMSCTNLKSCTVALPNSITNAAVMFMACINLTSFQSDMPSSLTDASQMFMNCKLDKESLQRIAETIPDVKDVAGQHAITIGYDSSKTTASEANDFKDTIALKGWEVTMQSI